MRAIGANLSAEVVGYVRAQLAHADLADPRYRATLAAQAIEDGAVDLAQPSETNSGRYWYNLHLVMVLDARYRIGREDGLLRLRPAAVQAARDGGCRIKALAIMPDHVHVALRGNVETAPSNTGLGFQNALAQAVGCRAFQERFYVGSFGEYSLDAVGA